MSNYNTIKTANTINTGSIIDGAISTAKLGASVTTLIATGSSPKITVLAYPGDDQAADPAGGQTITLTGTGFITGCTIFSGSTQVGTVTFISETSVTFTTLALASATYTVYLINPDGGTAALVPGISYSGLPNWTTSAGSIASVYEYSSISSTVTATGDSPVSYAVYSGSLPSGSSLNTSTGLISGTSIASAGATTSSFVIRATDAQLQDSDRSFSITVNTDVVTWASPTDNSTVTLPIDSASSTTLLATSAAGKSITYTANALPTGLSVVGNAVTGTPTVTGSSATLFTATAATDGKTTTATINWVVSVALDPYFNSVTLLLSASTPTSNFIADASVNTFAIAPSGSGTPSANTNNPVQPGYYSGSFNGSSQLTCANNAAFAFFTSNFTVECWLYPLSSGGQSVMNYSNGQSANTNWAWEMYQNSGTQIQFAIYDSDGATGYTASSIGLLINTWNHIAVVRNGNTMSIYVNGVVGGTTTSVTGVSVFNKSGATLKVSGYNNATYQYTGYVSNARIVKGIAVYTGAFTPPTAPLQATQTSGTNIAAITGTATSLLTCQSYRFIDNSPTPQTITASGTPSISVTQPFTLPSPYTGYGSGLFNGSGDYFTLPSNQSQFSMSTGDFTIEMWVYITSLASGRTLYDTLNGGDGTGTGRILIQVATGGTVQFVTGAGTTLTSGGTLLINSWYHLAVTKASGSTRIYVNGVQVNTTYADSNTYTVGTVNRPIIGVNGYDNSTNPMLGYISNLRITKGTAVYTGAFTPPTLAPLTNAGATSAAAYPSTTNVDITFASSATSLLTLQNNQAQNNNQFRDSSTNNFAVTRTGTPTQGTFTPFSQTGWGGYFNGSSYISVPKNTALEPATSGAWTIEFFFYTNSTASQRPWTYGNTTISAGPDLGTYCTIIGGGVAQGGFYSGSGGVTVQGGTVPLNQWNHLATVSNGTTMTLYLNGVSVGTPVTVTGTSINAPSSATGRIGVYASSDYFDGYISNFRFVKGVAVYTGAFTPPTTTLQATQSAGTNIAAITGTATSLLTLQDNRFKDNAVTPSTITVTGTPSIQSFSPFAPTTLYSASAVGGSVYFPGSSNLLVPSNASLALGTGDFTIEMWAYNASTTNRLISYATANSPIIYINTSNYVQYDNYGTASLLTSSILTPLNTWNHIAIVRLSGTTKMYINGVQAASGADATSYGQNGIYIGTDVATTFMTGYLSNVRIVKGTAVYTGAFIPSTTPLTAIAGTSVLLNTTNSGIYDSTGKNDLTTVGDARTSTAVIKYGSSSMYFDGTGDYLSLPASPVTTFGSNNFTLEFWLYVATLPGTRNQITYLNGNPSGYAAVVLQITATNKIGLTFSETGSSWKTDDTTGVGSAITASTWQHVALVRSGQNMQVYLGGAAQGSPYTTTAATTSLMPTYTLNQIGVYNSSSFLFTGYLTDFRITNYARYTTTFTPPTAPFTGQ